MLSSPFVPNIVKKIGTRWTITTGLFLVSIAFISMSFWPTTPTYGHVIASMLLMMTGMSLTMTPSTNLLMSAIPRNRAGMGSATNDTTRELGGALGVAVLGSVISSIYTKDISISTVLLPPEIKDLAGQSLTGALGIAQQLGPTGANLAEAAKAAWMHGLSISVIIAAGIVAVAAVISAVWLPHHLTNHGDDEIIDPSILQ